ncbi:unnamed protein product [Rotaria sp. Silwood1]|nr:unnamed protein product [Rotaria sp. Silwood1]CAF3415419.1 unnamed protein product [Rotaria sp. Silwood1]CAF3469890.1 unnamed protein product [Rotaria sp. Silwood1]CAF4687897.1 unnamed protein product [Rotaria sp. Silwood1]CAF4709833.1 unnamed protein product [Rotaria sp. Silwood1]
MGCNNGKQHDEKGNNKKQSTIQKVLRFQSRRKSNPPRPVSYAGIDQHHEQHHVSTRPLSMFDALPTHVLEIKTSNYDVDNQHQTMPERNILSHLTSRQLSETTESIISVNSFDQTTAIARYEQPYQKDGDLFIIDKSNETLIENNQNDTNSYDENDWKYYTPLTLEKIRTIPILKDIVYHYINNEFFHILNRLLRLEKNDENEEFLEWFFDELEYLMHSLDDNNQYEHKSLLLSAIEQDRYDCMKYLLERQLLTSKLDINITNDQGRHCLLMLAHRNSPIDSIKYLLTRHLACLDTNKLDLNAFSSLHHACRHFNLPLCELLLPHTNKKLLQMENSELRTPLDYWIECLCSLKKLKPTNIHPQSGTLCLDYLLNDADYHCSILFFQKLISHGGQLTKIPLRYIRSVLPHLTFEQKLSYVDHHVNLCCTLYKNRLSTLIRDYDNLKISIQAGDILTEFIYALGIVQLEVQTRLAAHAYSSVYETAIQHIYRENNLENSNNQLRIKEQNTLQSTMRMLYFKFFRLFQCIYNNPDVNVKNFHFEHIFRRVWVYWKEPVKAFIVQCKEKNSSLKSLCRILLFKRLINYPADIQNLPINLSLKQFVAFDNPFFVVEKKY